MLLKGEFDTCCSYSPEVCECWACFVLTFKLVLIIDIPNYDIVMKSVVLCDVWLSIYLSAFSIISLENLVPLGPMASLIYITRDA